MLKVGTVKELEKFEKVIDREVYLVALRIVVLLDEAYGADRDVENGDGGFVLIADNVQDVALISERYVRLDSGRHEVVDIVKYGDKTFINVLFLSNNEFGINVLIPVGITPCVLLRDVPLKIKKRHSEKEM